MKKQFVKYLFSLIINLAIIGLVIYALYEYCYDSIENIASGVHKIYEENSFSYFTTLSNIFVLVVCIISIPFIFSSLFNEKKEIPKWLQIIRHMSTTYIIITFLIVNILLVWIVEEPYELYEGKEIITHVVSPLLAISNLFLVKNKCHNKKKRIITVLIPMLTYSIIYYLNVFVFKVWADFYSVGLWYPYSIFLFMILFCGLGIAVSELLLRKKEK